MLTAQWLRAAVFGALCASGLIWSATAHSAATVSKLSLLISANPTTLSAKDFNENVIGAINRDKLTPRDFEGLDKITFSWFYDAQLRYFVRPNFAVEFGAGQIRTVSKREFLPTITAAIQYRAEVLSVPVHVGGAYYLPAYNQGDFQARMYVGGGLMSLVYNRERLQAVEANTDPSTTLGGDFKLTGRGDSPGYYVETGVHMFFASRFSVMLGTIYRSAVVRDLVATSSGSVPLDPTKIPDLDMSGIGARFAGLIGF